MIDSLVTGGSAIELSVIGAWHGAAADDALCGVCDIQSRV